MVSGTTTQLYYCRVKAAVEDTQMNDWNCVPIKLYLQKRQQARFSPKLQLADSWSLSSYLLTLNGKQNKIKGNVLNVQPGEMV